MHTQSPAGVSASRQILHYVRARAWCEWEDFDLWPDRVRAELERDDGAVWPPFLLLAMPGIDAATQRACATRWLKVRLAAFDAQGGSGVLAVEGPAVPRPEGPLKIGYLSGDFHQHATALLMVEMLEAHSAAQVELYAYSHGKNDGKGMRERLVAAFHRFRDIGGLTDLEAADVIRADGVDILVDLKGYTEGSRTMLLAHR